MATQEPWEYESPIQQGPVPAPCACGCHTVGAHVNPVYAAPHWPVQGYAGPSQQLAQGYVGPSPQSAQDYVGPSQQTARGYVGPSQQPAQDYVGRSHPAQGYVGPSPQPVHVYVGASQQPTNPPRRLSDSLLVRCGKTIAGTLLAVLILADVGVNAAHNAGAVVSRIVPVMDDRPFYFDPLALVHDMEKVLH